MLFLHGSISGISAVIQDVFFVSYKVVVCRHKDRVAGLFYHFSFHFMQKHVNLLGPELIIILIPCQFNAFSFG